MFKNKFLIKAVSVTVMGSFALASAPETAKAERLVPLSFSRMYSLAQNGEVEALRGSVRRGMNIDVMNQNGDTGLCIAARRRDSYTYNAFRAAGANPRHPCTQSIYGYEEFVNSANTAPINSTSRAAFGMMGKEDYAVAPWVWWTAGALALGAGIALAVGGGGGGGGGGSSSAPKANPIDSAGKYLAKKGKTAHTAEKSQNKINSSSISYSNSKTDIIDSLIFNENVTENSKNLNVILKAVNGGSYVNSEDTVLTAGSGVVAMSAYKNDSLIVNNGQIRANGNNASIGMLAGQDASARNNGQDSNGIYMSFSGTDANHIAIGMYGDAGARITNNGVISGTVSAATNGTLVGMEEMIINANIDSKHTTLNAVNTENGIIRLTAGTGENSQVNIIGMGSYLDDGILNGNKVIANAEKATLINRGNILLQYLRKYTPDTDYFNDGIGGIVGMKSDANSTATNEKNITIEIAALETSSITTDFATIAGMQSVHGSTITNAENGKIRIEANLTDETSNQSAYGMVGVKGGGKVAENLSYPPVITNKGEIVLNINNGYAMATYIGGTLTNDATIILGGDENSTFYENNVGMYDSGQGSYDADLINNGDIIIYSANSDGIKTDYKGKTTLTNDGTITIKKSAVNSHPFAGKYSSIINNGDIIYETTPANNEGSDGSFPDNFSFDLKDAVISTNGDNSLDDGEQKPTVTVTNKGNVILNGSSYTAAIVNHNAKLGTIINEANHNITINDRTGEETGTSLKNIGMYVTNSVANGSSAINRGFITVNTKYSAGMASDASAESVFLTNAADATITTTKDYSIGMYASDSSSTNNFGTISVEGKNSYGIVVKGQGTLGRQQEIRNNVIVLKGDASTAIYIADDSTAVIIDAGTIKVQANDITGFRYGKDVKLTKMPDFEIGDDYKSSFTYFNIAKGKLELAIPTAVTSNGKYFAVADGNGYILILKNTVINTGIADSTLIKGISSSLTSTNNSNLNLRHTGTTGMYAANGHTVVNSGNGTINTTSAATSSYGMYADDSGTADNNGDILAGAQNSTGMYAAENGTIVNNNQITASGSSSVGMFAKTGGSETNEGYIYSQGASAKGMQADAKVDAVNNNTVYVSGTNAYGMFTEASLGSLTNNTNIIIDSSSAQNMKGMYVSGVSATATNNGTIDLKKGNSSTGIYAASNGTGVNESSIVVKSDSSYGMYADEGNINNNDSIIVNGLKAEGMHAATGGTATNNGTVEVIYSPTSDSNAAYGMYASGGTVTNQQSISAEGDYSYGMYAATNGTATNKAEITVSGNNAKGMFATGTGGRVTNANKIDVLGSGSYGMYAESGANAINNSGKNINVSAGGAYGMYATSGTATNSGTITVSANNAYGMYATAGTVTNGGSINVSGIGSYGMYAATAGTAINNATITISGAGSYGMYAANGGTVINNGTISIGNNGSYGIYNNGGTYYNYGNITGGDDEHKIYPPEEDEEEPASSPSLLMSSPKSLLSTSNYGKIINNGTISADEAINFSESTDDTGTISVGNGGSYVASSFSGNVVADSNIVSSGFDSVYTNTDSFVGEDNGLNITSGSYLFNAEKSLNENGNIDVVMTKKDFADVVEDSSLAEFLEQNYNDKNNESLFSAIKSAENSLQFNNNLDSLFGKELLSDLTFEDLNVLRELNFDMTNNLFEQKKGSFNLSGSTALLKGQKITSGGQYALSGYNDGKNSIAVGLAVSDTKTNQKSSHRKGSIDKSVMISIPMAHKTNGFELIASPKFGYSTGSYEREGLNGQTYDGMIEKRTFALMNEARYPLNFGGVKIIPSAEFNMIGYNIKGREEKSRYSLNIDSQNHYSVESGLGLNIQKEFALHKESKLKLNGGVAVYKEFADPYELKVGMNEMNGTYRLNSEKYGDKRTVLRFGAGYSLKENIELSAGIRANIAHEYNTDAGVNLNYRF